MEIWFFLILEQNIIASVQILPAAGQQMVKNHLKEIVDQISSDPFI